MKHSDTVRQNDHQFKREKETLASQIKKLTSRNAVDTVRRALISTGCVCATILLTTTGCLFHKTSSVTTNPITGIMTTNVVVTVDQTVLAGDCLVAEIAATQATQRLLGKSQSSTNLFRAIEMSLNGVISGATTNSASQVIALIGKGAQDPATQQEITQLVTQLSTFEQGLVQKYGSTVAGQVIIAIGKAVYNGMQIALPMQ